MSIQRSLFVSSVGLVFALGACAHNSESGTMSANSSGEMHAERHEHGGEHEHGGHEHEHMMEQHLASDGQVAAVGAAADNSEIAAGRIASQKATDPEVREFAMRMVEHHTHDLEATTQFCQQHGITPEENPISMHIAQHTAEAGRMLDQTPAGPGFDREYIRGQLHDHEMVLHTMDASLMPSARNPEFRAALANTRAMVAEHLELVRRINARLGG